MGGPAALEFSARAQPANREATRPRSLPHLDGAALHTETTMRWLHTAGTALDRPGCSAELCPLMCSLGVHWPSPGVPSSAWSLAGWLALGAAHPVLGTQHPTERQWACGPGWAPRRRAPRTAVALSLTFSWAGRPWAGFLLVSKSREPNPEFVLIFPHFHLSSWRTSVNSVQIQKERTA